MSTESINERINEIQDPATARAVRAIAQSLLTDLTALKTAHNIHSHVTAGVAGTGTVPNTLTTPSGIVGNLNTTT